MNTKGNNLDEVSERLIDAVLADNLLSREKLVPRIRHIIQAWVRVSDRPADYNTIKTDKGILQKTIEQKDLEKDYWRHIVIENVGKENMQTFYNDLQAILKERGFLK